MLRAPWSYKSRLTVAAAAGGALWGWLLIPRSKDGCTCPAEQHRANSTLVCRPAVPSIISLPFMPKVAMCESARAQVNVPSTTPVNVSLPLPGDDAVKLKAVRDRFKAFASGPLETVGARLKYEKDGVKIFSLAKEGFNSVLHPEGGLPTACIGEVVIGVPAEQVEDLWWRFDERNQWDRTVRKVEELACYDRDTKLVREVTSAGLPLLATPREYIFVSHKLPPSEVGAWSGSYVFAQVDASDAVPPQRGVLRGQINSVLVIEPVDSISCRVRYLLEVDHKGWLLHSQAVRAAEAQAMFLSHLKKRFRGAQQ